MKLIKYKIVAFLLSCFLIESCTTRDDEFSIPAGAVESALIVTNIEEDFETNLISRIGGNPIRLLDASASLSPVREWIFPDDNVEVIVGDLTSERLTIRPLEEGELRIVLRRGNNEDTETITILGPARADFDVAGIGLTSFDKAGGALGGGLVVEAGSTLTFSATGENDVDIFEWTFDPRTNEGINASDLNQETLDVTFRELGTFGFRLKSSSSTSFANFFFPGRIAVGTGDTQITPFFTITVTPSSQPLLVEPIVSQLETGELAIQFSRNLNPSTVDDISQYTVVVDGVPNAVTSAVVPTDNQSRVLLTLATPIGNTQTGTVSYNRVNLLSSDGAAAPSATDLEINTFKAFLDFNGGFEGLVTGTVIDAGGNEYTTSGNFLTQGPPANIVPSIESTGGVDDSAVLKYTFTSAATSGNRRAIFGDGTKTFDEDRVQKIAPVAAGDVFVVSGQFKFTGARPQEVKISVSRFPFGQPFSDVVFDTSTLNDGDDFVELSTEVTIGTRTGENGEAYPIIQITASGGVGELFIDDIKFLKKS